jgi:hypothetical protein
MEEDIAREIRAVAQTVDFVGSQAERDHAESLFRLHPDDVARQKRIVRFRQDRGSSGRHSSIADAGSVFAGAMEHAVKFSRGDVLCVAVGGGQERSPKTGSEDSGKYLVVNLCRAKYPPCAVAPRKTHVSGSMLCSVGTMMPCDIAPAANLVSAPGCGEVCPSRKTSTFPTACSAASAFAPLVPLGCFDLTTRHSKPSADPSVDPSSATTISASSASFFFLSAATSFLSAATCSTSPPPPKPLARFLTKSVKRSLASRD